MARKWPNISIISIMQKLSVKNWNDSLALAYKRRDVTGLKKLLYGIQADMSDLAATGANSNEITTLFLRLQRSIEETAKKIFVEIYPSPMDSGKGDINIKKKLLLKHGGDTSSIECAKKEFQAMQTAKRKRDAEFQKFIKESKF